MGVRTTSTEHVRTLRRHGRVRRRRLWIVRYRNWQPYRRYYWLPMFEAAQGGRRGVMVPLPGWGWIAAAYRSCECATCTLDREGVTTGG